MLILGIVILISGFVLIVLALANTSDFGGDEGIDPRILLYPGLILMVIGMIFSIVLGGNW